MYTITSNYSNLELALRSNARESYTVVLSGPGLRAEATVELEDAVEQYDHPAWFFQSIARHETPWPDVESFGGDQFGFDAECSPSGTVTLMVRVSGTTGTETWTVSAPLTVGIDQLHGIAEGVVNC